MTLSTVSMHAAKNLEDTLQRFRMIPFARVEHAADLRWFMAADAWHVSHIADLSKAQEEEIVVLEDLLQDYGEIWSELGPTDRREALQMIFERIGRLQSVGLCVAVAMDAIRRTHQGSLEPRTVDVLRVLVSSTSQPQLIGYEARSPHC